MKWGLLGYGRIALKFEESIKASEKDEIVAVASRSQYDTIPSTYKRYQSYEALLADPEVEIVYVCTTHNTHKQLSITALNAGKHVLCEKPMSTSPEDVREMAAVAKQNDKFLMEAIWSRYLPGYHKAIELIKEGAIGEIQMVHANFGFYMNPADPKERLINPSLAGGAVWDVGIYPIQLALSIYGEDPSGISAMGKLNSNGVEESALINMSFSGGGLAQLSCSYQAALTNNAWITGTKGKIIMKDFWMCEEFVLSNDEGTQEFKLPMTSTGYYHEIRACESYIVNKLTESERIPWNDSIGINVAMEEVIRQCKT